MGPAATASSSRATTRISRQSLTCGLDLERFVVAAIVLSWRLVCFFSSATPAARNFFHFSAVRLRRLRRSVQPTQKTTRPVDGIRNGHSCKNCCYIVCATLLMYNAIDFASSLIKGEHWGCENFPYFSSSIATTQTKNSWLFCFYHSLKLHEIYGNNMVLDYKKIGPRSMKSKVKNIFKSA